MMSVTQAAHRTDLLSRVAAAVASAMGAPAQPVGPRPTRAQRRKWQRLVSREISRLAGESKLQRKGRKSSIW